MRYIWRKVNWSNIFTDFGLFCAAQCIVCGTLLGFQVKLPFTYLNFLLACGIILSILTIIYLIDYLKNKRSLTKKKATNIHHSIHHSFPAKIKGRYIQ